MDESGPDSKPACNVVIVTVAGMESNHLALPVKARVPRDLRVLPRRRFHPHFVFTKCWRGLQGGYELVLATVK